MKRRNHLLVSTILALSAALFASPAAAQISFIKTIGTIAPSNNGTSTTITVPAAGVAVGNSVILSLAMNPAAGTVSCSDTRGNAYTSNRDVTNGSGNSGVRTVVLSAHNIIALSSGNTISCTHPSVMARALSANEFSGLAASATADQVQSAIGTSTAPSSGSTPVTTQASELLIGGIGIEGPTTETFTAGASYTTIGRTGTSGGNAANNITINPEYRIVSATGTYSATGTLSASRKWAAAIVTYKAALPVATKLVITSINGGTNPTAGVGFPVVVQSQNASGSPTNVIGATAVSLSLKTGTGTLGGTLTGTIVAGTNQVTITGVTYTKAESGVVITATRTSGDHLTAGDSAAFTVIPGAATKVVFSTQPGNSTAGSPLSGPPTAVVQDSLGNTVTSSTASITVAIGSNPGGGTLSGTSTRNASGGVASFGDLSIDKAANGYTLTASATGITSATSSTLNIGAAAASKVVFTTQPANATAGAAIGGPPTVTVQDSFGNTVTTSTASITVAIGTNPGGGTLSGTTPKNASGGVASFSDLSINKAGTGYTLTASATGLTGATSNAFNISAGTASQVAFTTQPTNVTAGSAIGGPPTVTVQDSFGNTVTSSTATITIAIGTNPGSGTLSGTTAQNASSGIASFTNLSIDKTATGYTLTATATGVIGATSSAFNITVGAAAKLVFSTQPTSSSAGVSLGGPPTVTVQDSFGNNVTSSTASITVAIGTNPNGGTLSGTTPKSASAGVASFSDLSIDKVGAGYTLTAIATGLTSATSSTFNISAGAASQIAFTTLPANATAGTAIPGPTTATVQDSFGNTVASSAAAITVAIGNNPGGGTLSGTTTKNASAGVATFTDLSIDKSGSSYTITASATGLTAATSSAFNISAAAASNLVFITQPTTASAGSAIGGPPTVTVQDSFGNTVTSSAAAIAIAIGTNPGSGTLSGTTAQNASSGIASFTDLSIDNAANGYTLTVSSTGLTGATSSTFNITVGAAAKLVFSTQPTSANAGVSLGGPPTVTVQDSLGNTVTSSTAYITVVLGANPGGSTLSGNSTIFASSGNATFNDLSLNKAATGYTLTASSAGLTGATSSAFNISAGAAAAIAFTTQPGNANVGSNISGPPTITVQDSLGNTVTSSTAYITIVFGANPSGGTLSGTTTKNAASGVANFNDLSINLTGNGYTLTASATGLTGATSGSFNITAASGVSLTATPTSLTAGNPFTVTWAQIANPTQSDWIGLYTPGSSETSYISYIYVSCTSSSNVVAPSGSCQFTTSNYLSAGTYEFRLFTNNSYTRIATSNAVTVTPGLILTANPSSVPVGATVTVAWSNNPNPSSTDYIKLLRTANGVFVGAPIYVSCTQTPSVPLASGSCPYVLPTSLVLGTYVFQLFTNDTNTVIASSNFVSVVPPSKLAVYANQNPTAGPPGFSMTVEAQTSSGYRANVLTDTAVSVTLKTGTGVLSGALNGTIPAGSSQVTIGLATYTKAESGVVVTATRTSGDTLAAADSAPFTVNGGAPVSLVFVTQPGNTTAGSTISGPPRVAFQDVLGNVTSSAAPVTVAIGTNPSGGTLSGNMTVTTTSSVAFTTLSINQTGNGYTLTVSSIGVVGATSNPFNITSSGGGGTISGVVTRVSNGATITGALVEAFQGSTLRGTAVTNSSGNYSITGLGAGNYTVRASFTGLVPQMVSNVPVIDGSTTTVPLSLNFGIAVQSPIAGATINDFSVLVTGFFDTSLAPEVGITVNGYVALQDGNEFAALIPIDSQTTIVTATLKDTAGNLIAGDAVPITPQLPNTAPLLFFRPSPVLALVSQPVGFTLTSVNPSTQIQLDGNGDGTIDYTGGTLQGVTVNFAESGLYFPTVSVTEEGGTVRTATTLVQVFDATQLDMLLQNKWTAMKNALRQGDVTAAASHIVMRRRATYAAMFNALTVPLSSIDQVLTSITLLEQRGIEAEYEMLVNEGGSQRSYMVLFAIDEDGVWRVKFF